MMYFNKRSLDYKKNATSITYIKYYSIRKDRYSIIKKIDTT